MQLADIPVKVARGALMRSAGAVSIVALIGVLPCAALAEEGLNRNSADPGLIVTARRTRERLQDVPISITVQNDERLQRTNAAELDDVARAIPNLNLSPAGVLGAGQLSVRGVYSPVGAPTVGFYLDDTPIQIRPLGFSGAANPHLFDLDRVEVLRGPQGTLFGSGSLGGTVRFITKQPDLLEASGFGSSELSSTKGGDLGYRFWSAAGGPIVRERLAVRTGFYLRRAAGFVDRVDPVSGATLDADVNDNMTVAVRAAATAALTELVKISSSFYYQRTRSNDLPYFESTRGPHKQSFLIKQPGRDDFFLPSLTVEAQFDKAVLTSVSSYFDREDRRVSDYSSVFSELVLGGSMPGISPAGGTSNITSTRQKSLVQELRFASSRREARFNWVAGAFYQHSRLRLRQKVVEPGISDLVSEIFGLPVEAVFGAPLLPGGITYRGYESIAETQAAAFGEATWRLAETLELLGGVRLSLTKLKLEVNSDGPYAGPVSSSNRVAESQTETPLTPRLSLSYRPGADRLFYAGLSRGYRAGGANTPVPQEPCAADLSLRGRTASPPSFRSDSLWSYELGAKGTFPRHGLTISAASFLIDWRKIQQSISLPNCGFSFVENLGRARNRGFEVEADWTPTSRLHLSAAAGYVDARFRQTLVGGNAAGKLGILVESGDRVPFTPAWSVSAAGEYRVELAPSHRAYIRGEYQFRGSYQRTASAPAVGFNPSTFAGESYTTGNVRAGLKGSVWEAAVFINNVSNDRSVLFSNADLVPASRSPLRQSTLRPRTIGFSASARF